jgi:hypothetical protein
VIAALRSRWLRRHGRTPGVSIAMPRKMDASKVKK